MRRRPGRLKGWRVVTARTIRRGDRVDLGGAIRTVVDLFAIPRNGRRLLLDDGGSHCLGRDEEVYAYRHQDQGQEQNPEHDPNQERGG